MSNQFNLTTIAGKGKEVEFRVNDFSNLDSLEGRKRYEASFKPPEFTIKQLKESIPKELFERNTIKSLKYVVLDILLLMVNYYLASHIHLLPLRTLRYLSWFAYWIAQSVVMTGIWIIGHECGHYAFSDSKLLNDGLGFILHSFCLLPYFSWRISHAKHHSKAGHMDEDSVFVPLRRSDVPQEDPLEEALETSPIVAFYYVMRMLLFGWPMYLLFNMSGQKFDTLTSHFLPESQIFKPSQRKLVIISNIGIVVALIILGYFINRFSFLTVFQFYIIPYLGMNAWTVNMAYLQHCDVYVPHYNAKEWNFVRGALATVDRDYGALLNFMFHNSTDAHLIHHLFSKMPHYNAVEATQYLKPILGEYYLYDTTPFYLATYRSVTQCNYVEDQGDILFYRT